MSLAYLFKFDKSRKIFDTINFEDMLEEPLPMDNDKDKLKDGDE